ncbi:telomere-protecting terminal protein Tpg [Streptomyces fenghuangensis]|uniref:Telomere-protecting terminal protein Tpg n=1 Tax=Streptomyces chitinivorans TaxID=1257027 RepID=A0ABW7HW84_9ACTN|nr:MULTISPECIES: XRE family transcriptional regulator [Streptomyces]MCG3043020.1 XRE family transcriptional regulator [Streptomyces sp. ICN903]MDH2408472.1 XRE family transcriptional regulator [Streptomyces chitinivorans]
MGEIDDAIERAEAETFTRNPPKSLQARINFLLGKLKTTRAVAAELGVSQRSVERYRRGDRKNPPRHIADRIDAAVRARWQPLVRRRRRREAATTGGITIETRARFGYSAPIGSTDDPRLRRLTVHLPPAYADRLFAARQQGADDRQLRDIVAEGLREEYFRDGGRRAEHLDVAFTDIDYIDVSF